MSKFFMALVLAVFCSAALGTNVEAGKLYAALKGSGPKPSPKVFTMALNGHAALLKEGKLSNPDIITIIDVSLSSNKKRLWIIDLKSKEIIEHSLVAHGRNTGELNAKSFSNVPGSYKTSLGFYVTSETYIGKHGYSLRLDGVEEEINDKARERAIVMHGADYVSHHFITKHGRLGRSFGCPAVPNAKSERIINIIKEGSCLFIYHPNKSYISSSSLLKRISD